MRRIIIVDDSSSARMFIQRCIEVSGMTDCTFTEANNGEEAVSALEAKGADLVITDLTMPQMDGTELVKWMQGSPAHKAIPVIVITSSGNEAKKAELSQLGARLVLTKPISPQIISEALKSVF